LFAEEGGERGKKKRGEGGGKEERKRESRRDGKWIPYAIFSLAGFARALLNRRSSNMTERRGGEKGRKEGGGEKEREKAVGIFMTRVFNRVRHFWILCLRPV